MYKRILVPVENSAADRTIVDHVEHLAKLTDGELILVHVADGFAARHFDDLKLRESEEMREDRAYLDRLRDELEARGLKVEVRLAMGDPAAQIIKAAEETGADLIAMATHGHRGLGDVLRGQTADTVRHEVKVPVLLLRARKTD
jgi:nucleotide-binding universal stress UspA family protein